MLDEKLYHTTLALAGIFQAAALIKELAQTSKTDETAYTASIASIFETDPDNITSVYGNLAGVKLGLITLTRAFLPKASQERLLMRYVMALIHIQKKIWRTPSVLQQLKQRVTQIKKQVDYFSLLHPTVIANLADTYLTSISQFKFRILIWGSQRSLSEDANMNKIRALLLAGIRAATLWRQMGGSRLQLLFMRTKIKAMAERILADIEKHSTDKELS